MTSGHRSQLPGAVLQPRWLCLCNTARVMPERTAGMQRCFQQAAPACQPEAMETQGQQSGCNGGEALAEVPMPGVSSILRTACLQQIESEKLPGHQHPPAQGRHLSVATIVEEEDAHSCARVVADASSVKASRKLACHSQCGPADSQWPGLLPRWAVPLAEGRRGPCPCCAEAAKCLHITACCKQCSDSSGLSTTYFRLNARVAPTSTAC